jgi:hypothetical protein
MSYPDRVILSMFFITATQNTKGIEGQRIKSIASFLIFLNLAAGNLLVLSLLPDRFLGKANLGLLIFEMLLLFVCPFILLWPIVATYIVRADLEKLR